MKTINICIMCWFASHLDSRALKKQSAKSGQKQEPLHHHKHKFFVVKLWVGLLAFFFVVLLTLSLTWKSKPCGESATVLGQMTAEQSVQDEVVAPALPRAATLVDGSPLVVAVDGNASAVAAEYVRCARAAGVADTASASPPLAELVQMRTPYCGSCDVWVGGAAADGMLPGASAAARTCVAVNASADWAAYGAVASAAAANGTGANASAAAGQRVCVAVADAAAPCPSGFARCDAARAYADVAMTNGACKRYVGAFRLAYDALNPAANTSLATLEFAVDRFANLTFPACNASARVDQWASSLSADAYAAAKAAPPLACARAGDALSGDSVLTLTGTAPALAAAVNDFWFCPRCVLETYTVAARVAGDARVAACARAGGVGGGGALNMTVFADSALRQTLVGVVRANGTNYHAAPIVGATVRANVTQGRASRMAAAEANTSAAVAELAVATVAAEACGYLYNFTTTTDANGAYTLTMPYPIDMHEATVTVDYEHHGFAGETRAVSLDAVIKVRASLLLILLRVLLRRRRRRRRPVLSLSPTILLTRVSHLSLSVRHTRRPTRRASRGSRARATRASAST